MDGVYAGLAFRTRSECLLAGKTTLLRDIASTMADRFKQRVVVVDTNGELGGDGSVPHKSLRNARRLPVSSPSRQHEVMREALRNHKPAVSCESLPACCCIACSVLFFMLGRSVTP